MTATKERRRYEFTVAAKDKFFDEFRRPVELGTPLTRTASEPLREGRIRESLEDMDISIDPRWYDWQKLYKGHIAVRAEPFRLPDQTGVTPTLDFWLRDDNLFIRSRLEVDVNSSPKGELENEVLFHALALHYPPFSDGRDYPVVKVDGPELVFAPLDKLSDVKKTMAAWYKAIGKEQITELDDLLRLWQRFEQEIKLSSEDRYHKTLIGQEAVRAYLVEKLAKDAKKEFMHKLLKAMGKLDE